jgi:transposase
MKKVEELSEIAKENLVDIRKNHPKYRERERAWGILLSSRGYSPQKIGDLFEISDRIVYKWIDNFNKYGIMGLMTQQGQGRKAILKKR